MTITTSLDAPGHSAAPGGPPTVPPAATGPPPSIVANRRRLDNRFPVLAFAVSTHGRPHFEVLLTTDRTLFDPANASRRTPSNFYAGRQDGGLMRAAAEETAYVVPAAVLKRFVDAQPRPSEIFYTVAAYDDPNGAPVLAQPPQVLSTTAPSVLIGGDFRAQTLSNVLSVPADKLRPVTDEPPMTYDAGAPLSASEQDDDGIPVGEATSWSSEQDEEEATELAAEAWGSDVDAMALDADEPVDPPVEGAAPAGAVGYGAPREHKDAGYEALEGEDHHENGASPARAYEDGYDEETGYGGAEAEAYDDEAYGHEGESYEPPQAQTYEDGYDEETGYGQGAEGEAYDDEAYDDAAYGPEGESYEPPQAQTYEDGYVEETGYGQGAEGQAYEHDGEPYAGAMADLDGVDYPYPEAKEAGEDPEAEADEAQSLDYDDGYPGDPQIEESGWSEAEESAFPEGTSEPAALTDVDDERLDAELAAAGGHDEPYEDADVAAGAMSNGGGPAAGPPAAAAPVAGAQVLDIPAKIAIVTKLGRKFESRAGYAGINADTEYSNPRLPQYQRWHVGLSYGFVQFTQDSGMLGRLLHMMRERDAATFREVFGPDSDELVRVTTRRGPSSRSEPGGRSARVQPVGGADLWTEPWLSRFRAAGAHPPFQAAQNELAVRAFVDPMLGFAAGLGTNTERSLAMVVDRAIQMGVGGSRRWIVDAVAPIRTNAQRQQALGALGVSGVREFQQAAGLRADGDFGPTTHAAMVGALRRLGPASPVPIPTRDQLMDGIVDRAEAQQVFWRHRPRAIRTDPEFADVELTWTSPAPAARP